MLRSASASGTVPLPVLCFLPILPGYVSGGDRPSGPELHMFGRAAWRPRRLNYGFLAERQAVCEAPAMEVRSERIVQPHQLWSAAPMSAPPG